MFGTLNELGQTNSGGPKYKIDGKWVYPDRQCNTDGIQPGMRVEYDTKMGGRDGKLTILTRVRPAPQQNGSNGHAAPSGATEVSPLDDSGMRFVSNVVGSAIMAGKLEKPFDVTAWTIAAYRAFKALGVREPGLDDDLGDEEPSENPAPKDASW